jgi:hypothetical protein
MPPRRRNSKDTPAKLVKRMKRRWRVVLLRAKGEILGTVEAPHAEAAKAAAAVQFNLDESAVSGSWCRSWREPGGVLARGAKSSCRLRRKLLGSMGTRLSPAAVDTAPGLHLSQRTNRTKRTARLRCHFGEKPYVFNGAG